MKQILVFALAAVLFVGCLAGCGSFKCDICNKEKGGKKHQAELMGEEFIMCDECYKILDEGFAEAGDLS